MAWSPEAAVFFRLPAEAVLGKRCAEVVAGTDGFGRPLCGRCPVQREIRRGAYQASTALSYGGKRLICQGYAGREIGVGLKPERQTDAGEVLASLSRAVRTLTDEPGRLFQTLQVFLAGLRKSLKMEAAELFWPTRKSVIWRSPPTTGCTARPSWSGPGLPGARGIRAWWRWATSHSSPTT